METVLCPYCDGRGFRIVRVFRFWWEDGRIPVRERGKAGWGKKRGRCVVCRGAGVVPKPSPVRETLERLAGTHIKRAPIREDSPVPCHICGGRADCKLVEPRKAEGGKLRTWLVDKPVPYCVVCRAGKVGGWRYPRTDVRPLKIVKDKAV